MICSKCLGRISAQDIDFKKKRCEKLGKPYDGPPKICCECVLLTILSWEDEPLAAEVLPSPSDPTGEKR